MTHTPYLSVVATARNDNHGGNMLRRMQIFVNGLIEQSRRYQLDTELLIVEWNPLPDRPRLSEALTFPVEGSPCVVRIIEVPPELHQQLRYAQSLPLFQMLAKNVGIRRAQGEFILATNIDLLFSDELFSFLAAQQLRPGKSYRIDRHDAASDVPLEAPITDQLNYCGQHLLRICHKDGIEEFLQEPEVTSVVEVVESITVESVTMLSPELPPAKWYESIPESAVPRLAKIRQIYKQLLPTPVRNAILKTLPKDFTEWLIDRGLLTKQLPPPPEPEPAAIVEPELLIEEIPVPLWQYPKLHTNACGDFTLMSKADWLAIRGYPEWEIFSMHLDSVLLYIAHYAGIEEELLSEPMRVYHIEHASGWTPQAERDQSLNQRLAKLQIPQLSMEQFDAIVRLMEQTGKPLIINNQDWGMAKENLPEQSFSMPSLVN
ncbi:hypothetical protein [Pantanalinema sp. GBBB05]|uniref:hypothetical protein n=1 Tax=Pantanalinema sp. GBBB05 TaxID=2604139 RepID=UPI001D5630F0|nr:hypothetical protein [Pantanalinema sp. GBBB05]